jgi:head-tail adaptor
MLTTRTYNERVSLYRGVLAPDQYGAIEAEKPQKYATRWARVESLSEVRKMYYNTPASIESYEFTMRYVAERPRFIKWKEQMMVVESATDVDNKHKIMRVVATKR